MANYEMRPGQGSVFPNHRRSTATHPQWTGKMMTPAGEKLWLSVWEKTTSSGTGWMSIATRPMDDQALGRVPEPVKQPVGTISARAKVPATPGRELSSDDDIPF